MDNRNRNGDSGETSNHKKKYHFDALRKLENNNNITDTNHQSILVFDFHSLDTKTDKKIEYVSKQWEAYKKFFSDVPGRLTQDISIGPAIEQIKQVWNTEKINNEKDQSEQQKIILKTMEEINNRIVTSLNPNLKSLKPNEVKNIEGSIRKLNRNLYNIDYEQYHKPQLIELQNVLKEHVDQVMSIKVEEGIKRLNDSLSRDNENTTLKEQYNLYKGHKKQLNNFISGIASMQEEYMKSKDLDHMNPLRTNLANVGTDSSYVNDFKKRLDTHINDRENLHQQHLHQLDQDILNLTELHKVLTDAGVSGDCTNNLNMNIQNLRKTANDYNTANQLEKGSVILNNYKTLLDTTKKEAFKNLDEHLNTLYHENGHKIFEICNKLRNVSLNPFEETNELIRNLKLEVQGYSKKDFPDLVDMSQSTENGNIKYRVFNSSYIKGYEMDDRKMLLELRLNRGLDVANMYHRFLMSLDMQYNNQMSKDVMDRIQAFQATSQYKNIYNLNKSNKDTAEKYKLFCEYIPIANDHICYMFEEICKLNNESINNLAQTIYDNTKESDADLNKRKNLTKLYKYQQDLHNLKRVLQEIEVPEAFRSTCDETIIKLDEEFKDCMTNKVFERDEIKDKFKSSLSDINQLYDEYIINLRESNDSKKLYQIYEKLDDENIFFSEFKEKIDNERAKELHENNLALFTKIGEFMMQQSLKTQFIKDMEKDSTTIALENHEKLNSYIEMKTSKEKRDAYQDFKSHIGQHYDTDCQLNKFLDKLLSRLTEEQPHKLYEMHKNLHGNITDQKLYLNVKNHIEKYCEELVHNDEKKHDKAREDLGKTHNFLDKLKDTSSHDEVQRSMKLTTEIPIDLNSKFRTYKETKVSSNIAGNPIDNLGKAILSAKWKAREKYYEAVGGYKGELDKILTSHLEKFLAEIPKDGDEAATQKLCDLYDDMNKSATTNPYCAEFKKKVESCMDEIIQKGIKNNTDCKNIIAKEKFLPHGTLDPLKNIDLTISKFSEYNNDSNFNGKKVTFLPDRSNQFKNAWKSYRTFHERILEEMPELHKSIKEKLNSEDASTSGGAPGDGGASTSGGAPGDGGASTSGGAPGDGGASTSGGAPGDGGTPDGREGTSGDGDPFTHPKELLGKIDSLIGSLKESQLKRDCITFKGEYDKWLKNINPREDEIKMVPLDGPNREEHVNKLTLNHAELKKLLTAFRSEIEKITDEKITDEEKATKILNEWKDTKKSEGTYSKILKNDDKWQKLINGYKKEMDRHNELSPLAQEMLKEKYKEIAELKGKLETMSKKLETMSKKLEDAIKTRGSTPETARELKKAKTVGEVLNTLLDWIRHPTSDTNRKKRRALRMEKLTSDARGGGKPSILKNNTLRRWGPRVIKMALAAGIGIAAVATIPATHGLALVGGIIVGGMWYHYVRQDRKRKKEDRARQKNEGFENYVAGHNAENPT